MQMVNDLGTEFFFFAKYSSAYFDIDCVINGKEITKECVAIIAIMNLSNKERAPAEVISTGLGLGRVIDRTTRRGVRGACGWRGAGARGLPRYLCCTLYRAHRCLHQQFLYGAIVWIGLCCRVVT